MSVSSEKRLEGGKVVHHGDPWGKNILSKRKLPWKDLFE